MRVVADKVDAARLIPPAEFLTMHVLLLMGPFVANVTFSRCPSRRLRKCNLIDCLVLAFAANVCFGVLLRSAERGTRCEA